MPSDGFFARFDDRLEAQWLTVGVLSCVRFAHGKLPNGKPKEIESHVSLVGSQGMGDSCFLWVHEQTHFS